MYTLIFSIGCSVAVSILLKLAKSKDIDVRQAVAINYVTASSLCLVLLNPHPSTLLSPSTPWWILVLLGVLLPSIFLVMAAAVRYAGIVFSDAAQRLSLLIPLTASFLIFNETISNTKAVGILVAFIALFLLLIRPHNKNNIVKAANADIYNDTHKSTRNDTYNDTHSDTRNSANNVLNVGDTANIGPSNSHNHLINVSLLLGVWVGYGVIDILFKQMAKSGAQFSSSLLASFVMAGALMFAWLFFKRCQWNRRSLYAGVILGVLNFGNIFFYIRAHQAFPENPTLVFSAMNIGVITLGTIVGTAFFKEQLNKFNVAGIAAAIVAVLLLMPR